MFKIPDISHELTALIKAKRENYKREELDRMEKAKDAYNDFMLYYEKNKIYVNEMTCKLFTEIRNEYFETLIKYDTAQNLSQEGSFVHEIMKEVKVSMQKKIPKIREELENEIRGIIFVIEKSNNQKSD